MALRNQILGGELPIVTIFQTGADLALDSSMLEKFDAFQIAKKYYWGCKTVKVPKYLQDQLLRASSSIALNTAEGSGKRTPPDQTRFYSIALGSLRECEAILALEQINDPVLKDLGDKLGAILYTLSHRPNRTEPRTDRGTETETETQTGTVT